MVVWLFTKCPDKNHRPKFVCDKICLLHDLTQLVYGPGTRISFALA
jgi:hypothetical protein